MMFKKKIALDPELYAKLSKLSEAQGCASVEEFALHILEDAVKSLGDDASEEEVKKRLRGLGYLE